MVVVAEEVKNPRVNLPVGIIVTLIVTTLLYMIIMAEALLTFSPLELGKSVAPLADLYSRHNGACPRMISLVAIFAILNGVLVQIIMASRVLYGLARRNQLPSYLAQIHPTTQTPVIATLAATIVVLLMALAGRLATLAEWTSAVMLAVFMLVNLSLCVLKFRKKAPQDIPFQFPLIIPLLGFVLCATFVVSFISSELVPY